MGRPIRKQISLSVVDMEEIEKIKEKHHDLYNNSDVIKFLLYYYLQNEDKIESNEEKILSKMSHIDYELQLVHLLLKYITPDIFGETDSSHRFIKVEQELKKKLRRLD